MFNLRNRSFLKELDFTAPEFRYLLDLSAALKATKRSGTDAQRLRGKEIALVFEKTSTRTRSAFEVAAYDEGAHTTYMDPSGSQLGHKESVADTARVLGRMYDAVEFRGYRQDDVEALARHAGVPVYNGLTDEWHPTQSLADVLTMREHSGKPDRDISFAFLGDTRNNVARSLLVTAALLGGDVRLVGPEPMWPPDDVVGTARELAAQSGGRVTVTEDVDTGVAHVDKDGGERVFSTTFSFVRFFTKLVGDKKVGKLIVPIVPDESRTFGMDPLFRKIGIYSHSGQLYQPVDSEELSYYREAKDGQLLEEGITEVGSMASFIAAGTAHSAHGVNMMPFYIYYSMFGFQRIGDMIWCAADARAKEAPERYVGRNRPLNCRRDSSTVTGKTDRDWTAAASSPHDGP